MEIIKNFGLDPFLFGAQVINFLIVLYLLKRFLYKPVLDMLKKREDTIKEGLKQAEEARLLLEETVKKEKVILKKAQEAAKETIANAKEQANLVAVRIEEDSKKQAEKVLLEAKSQIELETKEAEKRLSTKIGDLSIEFLTSSIKNIFSEKEQTEIIDHAIKQIRKFN